MTDKQPIPFLDLKAQQARIAVDLRRRLDTVREHCQFVLGPEVRELEAELARFCGAKHCVSVSSGTDALQIAMMAEDIGRGDAVFLPAFTYTATAEVPLVLGATPVFVDVDPRTFQIDPVHGKMLGTQADATATSFFPSKPLGAYGDGGALFTESDDRADLYRSLRTHGEGKTRYEVLRTGMNGRLDSIQAAVLLAKLAVFPDELRARERIATVYDQRLGNALTTPKRVPNSTSAWAIYAVLLRDEAARDRMQAALKADGVPTAIYYPRPLHRQPAYSAQHDGEAMPVSDDLAGRIMALPIHPDLTDQDVERICDSVLAAV